jgi:hypothetical protein
MAALAPPIDEASDVREEERLDPEKLRPFLEQAFSRRGDVVSLQQSCAAPRSV